MSVGKHHKSDQSRQLVARLLRTVMKLKTPAAQQSCPECESPVEVDTELKSIAASRERLLLMAQVNNLWFSTARMASDMLLRLDKCWQASGICSTLPCQLLNGKPKPFMSLVR